jgi:hypothetical protein
MTTLRTLAERNRAAERAAALDAKAEMLTLEAAGLRAAAADYDAAHGPWGELTLARAVLRAVAETAGPEGATPKGVSAFLQDRGRHDAGPMDVSAALNRYRKSGDVVRVGYGRWKIPE